MPHETIPEILASYEEPAAALKAPACTRCGGALVHTDGTPMPAKRIRRMPARAAIAAGSDVCCACAGCSICEPEPDVAEALAEAEAPPLPFQETLIQSIRTRPGMYVGNMEDGYGLQRLFDVVLEYVVAQHLAGRCPEVFVDLSLTDSLTVMLCELRVEPKEIKALLFGEGQEFNLAPITALSKWVTFQSVPASRRRFEYTARAGKPLGVEIREADDTAKLTRISFLPDTAFFGFGSKLSSKRIDRRLREIAALNPGLAIHFDDWRWTRAEREARLPIAQPAKREDGPRYFVEQLREGARSLPGAPGEDTILVGSAAPGPKGIGVDFALCWRLDRKPEPQLLSFANQHKTKDGGHHVAALRRAALASVLSRIADHEFLTDVTRYRITEWLKRQMVACVAITHPAPSFQSPTRSVLHAPDVGPFVRAEVRRVLDAHFDEHPEDVERLSMAARVG